MANTSNDVDQEWPPKKTGGRDTVDVLMPNYVPDTGMPSDELGHVDGNPYPAQTPSFYPKISDTPQARCGTCKFFVEGGACALVKGKIDPINGICKFFKAGRPLEWDAPVFPVYEQPEANYHEMEYQPYLNEPMQEGCGCQVQEAFDESKHPRDAQGRFGSGSGQMLAMEQTDLQQKIQHIEEMNQKFAPFFEKEYYDENGYHPEPIHVSPQPTNQHMATAYKALAKFPDMDENFAIQQAWKADQLRTVAEPRLEQQVTMMKTAMPTMRVSGRVKGRLSMVEKLGRKTIYKDVSELGDVTGVRIIAKTMPEVDAASLFVSDNFNVAKFDDYIKNPLEGYRSAQFDIVNEDGIKGEIQARTENQDQWATFFHDNIYKTPEELKNFVSQNEVEIKMYSAAMSEYYKQLDDGNLDAVKPDCPPKLRARVGCL